MPIKREEKYTKKDRGHIEVGKETHFSGQYFEQIYLSDGLNVIKNDNNANKPKKRSFLKKIVSLFTKKKESNGNKRNNSVSPTTIRKYIDDGFILPHLHNPYCPVNYLPTELCNTNSCSASKLNENITKIIISNENIATCSNNEEDRTKYVQTDTKESNPIDTVIRTEIAHYKSTKLNETNIEKKSDASKSDKIANRHRHENDRKSIPNKKKGNVEVTTECLRRKTKIHGVPNNERDNKFLKYGKSKKKINIQVSYERGKEIEQYKNNDEFIQESRTSLSNSDITLVSNCKKSKQIIRRECSSDDHKNHITLENKLLRFNDNTELDSSVVSLPGDLYETYLEKDNKKKIAGAKIENIPMYSAYKTEKIKNLKSNMDNSSESNVNKKYTKSKCSKEKFYHLNNENVYYEKYKRDKNQLTATNATKERKGLTDENSKQRSDSDKCIFPLINISKRKVKCKIKESQLTENNSSSIESIKEELPCKNEYLLIAEKRNVRKYNSNKNVISEREEECYKKKRLQVPKSDSDVNNFSSEYYFDKVKNEININKQDNSLMSTNTNRLIESEQRVADNSTNSIGGHSSFGICKQNGLDFNNKENPLVEEFSQPSCKNNGKEDNRQPIISHPDFNLNNKQLISTKGMVWPKATTENINDMADLEIYRAGKFGRTFQELQKTENKIELYNNVPQTSSFMDQNDKSLLPNLYNTQPENMIKPQIQKLRQNFISNVSIYEEPDKYNSCNLLESKIISTFREDFNIIKSNNNREETMNSSLNISLQQFEDLKNNLCITLCTNDMYNKDHYLMRTISNVSSTDKLPIEYSATESLTERKTISSSEMSRSKYSVTESSTLSSKQTASSSNDTKAEVTQRQNSAVKSRQVTSEVNHTVVRQINSSIKANLKGNKKVNCVNNNNHKSVSLNNNMRTANRNKLSDGSKVTNNSTHINKQNNKDNMPTKKVCVQKCVNKNNENYNITTKVRPPDLKKKYSKTAVSTNYSGSTSHKSNLPKKKPKH